VRKNTKRSRDRFIQGAELPHFFVALNSEPNDLIQNILLPHLMSRVVPGRPMQNVRIAS